MFQTIIKSKIFAIITAFYLVLVCWWLEIYFSGSKNAAQNNYYGFFYAFIALIGGINGLAISKKWGGYKSLVGRAIIYMSAGLLLEGFGQLVWSYYNIFAKIEVPFPSIADVGYFLMIPTYTLGVLSFAKAAGVKYALRDFKKNLAMIVGIPIIMLISTYLLLLQGNSIDFSSPTESLRTFLNYYSPLGESVTISIAILSYFLSRKYLGGKMKHKILYILFAFIFEFITGMTFLYQAAIGTYYNGGINDLMFTTSFTIMSIGLIAFRSYE